MDNISRSEKTRNAVLQAALSIIARDGPGRLTLDAIARESGISKGGLMHQFRTKEAVLKALLERQIAHFENFSGKYMAEHGSTQPQPHLAAQIATMREALPGPDSVAFALLGAMGQEPGLLSITREIDAKKLKTIKAEAADPDLATLRWVAARGLVVTAVLGICPIPEDERERLFDRLMDDRQWSGLGEKKPNPAP
ncbi:MAG: TetR/AcrR family transcriptional regulator [Reyranella sp.]|nr:TetR/AcrR family transcriptional regulator [Reyranella sp.]